MDVKGPNSDHKVGLETKVQMRNEYHSESPDSKNGPLKNPISIVQIGPNVIIYTKKPLVNILHNENQKALTGPVSTSEDVRLQYITDLRYPFIAELEEGIELSSNGEGLFELEQSSTKEKLTLLDVKDALKYLKDAGAFEEKKKPQPPLDRDSELLLDMHGKPKKTEDTKPN